MKFILWHGKIRRVRRKGVVDLYSRYDALIMLNAVQLLGTSLSSLTEYNGFQAIQTE